MTDISTNPPVGPTVAAAESLRPLRIDYDVDAALEAGLTAADIAEYLASEMDYDIAGAREAGVTNDQIIGELSTARAPSRTAAVAEGTLRGGIVGGGALAGAATGAVAGAPLGPVGSLAGGTLGTIAGLFAGTQAERGLEELGALPTGQVVPGRRPFLEGGRTFGGGASFLAAPALAVRGIPLSTTRFLENQATRRGLEASRLGPIDQLLRSYQQRPGTFMAGETGALGAASVAGGLAEASDPGNAYLRMGAEILGGMANPVGVLSRFAAPASDAIRSSLRGLTPEGRANRLGSRLVEILENAGEDPEAVITALMRDDDIAELAAEMGVDLGPRTSALRSGSPTLTTLQRTIAAQNSETLGPTVARAAEQNLEGISRLISLMSQMEDPTVLATAAQMRDAYFRDALQMRLDQASAQAAEAAGRLVTDDPLAGQRAGEVVASIVGDALQDARAQERALYQAVDLTQPGVADNIIGTAAEIRSNLLPESPFPSLITRFVRRVSGEDAEEGLEEAAEVTLRDLVNFRSEMLSMTRDARAQGNFRDANFFGRMAEAALEDIGLRAGDGLDANQQALQNAYAFSRSLNDVFTRSFAGDVGATRRTGANRIPPELLANRIFGSGGDATSLRIADLEEAAQFMAQQAGPEFAEVSQQRLGTLRDAEQTILRVAAERTLNPETGQVNPVALSRFMQRNAATLERFPQLRADLENAVTAQQRLRSVIDANSLEARNLDNNRVFSALLGAEETPGGAVGLAIGTPGQGRRPDAVRNLNQLVRLANTAGDLAPQARAGLRDAVLDRAVVYATNPEGGFSFNRFRNFLLEPISRSQPSVAGVLRDGGVFTDAEVTQLNRLLREADRVQEAIDAGGPQLDEVVIDAPAAVFDLVTRIAGSAVGTGVSRAAERVVPGYTRGSGQGLIEAQAGSRLTRNLFENMPQTYFKDMLNEAISNPGVMEALLRRGVNQSPRARRVVDRRINAFLIDAGLQPAQEEIEDTQFRVPLVGAANAATPNAALEEYLQSVQQPAPAQPATPAASPRPTNATPAVGAPPPAVPRAAPAAPRAGGQGASYSALFPNDPISPMLQQRELQQGIGALMPGPR